jgi:hypothetical protein
MPVRKVVAPVSGGEDGAVQIAARAVSRNRTLSAAVDDAGFVVGVQLLKDVVRRWPAATLGDRVVAVAAVAHDRYLANNPDPDLPRPSAFAVAEAEQRLDF